MAIGCLGCWLGCDVALARFDSGSIGVELDGVVDRCVDIGFVDVDGGCALRGAVERDRDEPCDSIGASLRVDVLDNTGCLTSLGAGGNIGSSLS